MNSIVKKYIVINQETDESKKFDTEVEACTYVREQDAGSKFLIMNQYVSVEPKELKFRATLVLCVYKEEEWKMMRSINSCLNQDATGLEIIIYGDCSPLLNELISSKYFDSKIIEHQFKGNDLIILNNEVNQGGYGYSQRNKSREISRGSYTMYCDGDDELLPNHVSTRLKIAETDLYDLIGFDTCTEYNNWHRTTQFTFGQVGHAEIVIRTELLRKISLSPNVYGHDWSLVESAIHAGAKHHIHHGEPYTYIIKSTPQHPEVRKS